LQVPLVKILSFNQLFAMLWLRVKGRVRPYRSYQAQLQQASPIVRFACCVAARLHVKLPRA
jgi:hypothetical protein